ncbi:hypothetical protein OT109_10820 [Phycisphaeraceae bacterium D3-23]
MKTVCTHCNKWFQVHDRALGKRAKCKACGGVFVVRPEAIDEIPMQEVAPPKMGSTTRMQPAKKRETVPPVDSDPLAALASAADNSQHDHADHSQRLARERESFLSLREHGEKGRPAPGTTLSLILGIVAIVFALGTSVNVIVLAVLGKAPLAAIIGACGAAAVGGGFAIFAIIYGNGARKRIRRSRGVLDGKGTATTGMMMGWGALLIFGILACVGLILLIRTGPIITQTQTITN